MADSVVAVICQEKSKRDAVAASYAELFKALKEQNDEAAACVAKQWTLLQPIILKDISGKRGDDIARAAFRVLGFSLRLQAVAYASAVDAKHILDTIAAVANSTRCKIIANLAVWCFTMQPFSGAALQPSFDTILTALLHVLETKAFKSISAEHEALAAMTTLIGRTPMQMKESAVTWMPSILSRFLHEVPKIREQVMIVAKKVVTVMRPVPEAVADCVADALKQSLFVQLKAELEQAGKETYVLAVWGVLVQLLGDQLFSVNIINDMLSIPNTTFWHANHTLRIASHVNWRAIIDNVHTQHGAAFPPKACALILRPLEEALARDVHVAVRLAALQSWGHLIAATMASAQSHYDTIMFPIVNIVMTDPDPEVVKTLLETLAKLFAMPESAKQISSTHQKTPGPALAGAQLDHDWIEQHLSNILNGVISPAVQKILSWGSATTSSNTTASQKKQRSADRRGVNDAMTGDERKQFAEAATTAVVSIWRSLLIRAVGGDSVKAPFLHMFLNHWAALCAHNSPENNTLFTIRLQLVTALLEAVNTRTLLSTAFYLSTPHAISGEAPGSDSEISDREGTAETSSLHKQSPVQHLIRSWVTQQPWPTGDVHCVPFMQVFHKLLAVAMSSEHEMLANALAVADIIRSAAAAAISAQSRIVVQQLSLTLWSALAQAMQDGIDTSLAITPRAFKSSDSRSSPYEAVLAVLCLPWAVLCYVDTALVCEKPSEHSHIEGLDTHIQTWCGLFRTVARVAAIKPAVQKGRTAPGCVAGLCERLSRIIHKRSQVDTPMDSALIEFACASTAMIVESLQTEKDAHAEVLLLLSAMLTVSHRYGTSSAAGGGAHIAKAVRAVAVLLRQVDSAQLLLSTIEALSQSLTQWLSNPKPAGVEHSSADELKLHTAAAWDELCEAMLRVHSTTGDLCFDSALLNKLAPLLNSAMSTKYRKIKNSALRFWSDSFGKAPSLTYPELLRPTLESMQQKAQLSLPGWDGSASVCSMKTHANGSDDGTTKRPAGPSASLGDEPVEPVQPMPPPRTSLYVRKPKIGIQPSDKASAPVKKLSLKRPREDKEHGGYVKIDEKPADGDEVLTERQKEKLSESATGIPKMYSKLDVPTQDITVEQRTAVSDNTPQEPQAKRRRIGATFLETLDALIAGKELEALSFAQLLEAQQKLARLLQQTAQQLAHHAGAQEANQPLRSL